ncbi:PAS domain S-box protein [uncultured Methanobacterium sp.]|uniref:PAS domain S-box protein n=1 Tax=uncultured Methanobacterium sp. TaxID=176306 RepID=UPI002AA71BB1|nr:PAS domain S-box protein [uncultured Methanobacterium sp.]
MVDEKILLVEDESIEAMDIKHTLESFGYEVPYIATSGEEAVEKALEIMPDLILMDIVLKGDIDGVEAASMIKDLNIPFIYLTAHSEENTIERAKLTEPQGYIIKPYAVSELKYAIDLAIYKNKMEKEFKESEAYYRTIFEHTGTATVILEEDTTISLANAKFEKLSGYTREELEGKKSWTDFVVKDDLEKMEEYHHLRRNDPASAPVNYDFRFIDKQGNIKNIQLDVDMIPGTKNSVSSLLDITQRKQAEMALRESEERYKSIFDKSIDAIYIHDFQGNFVDANPVALSMLGYMKEEIEKISFASLLSPDQIPRAFKIINQIKNGGYQKEVSEYRLQKKDGSHIYVETKSSLLSFPGGNDLIQGIARDITSRKLAEEALKESERSYRNIFENSGIALLTFKNDGTILMFNSEWERLSGYPREDVEGKMKWMEIAHPDYRKKMMEYHQQRIKDPDLAPQEYETVFIKKNGEQRVAYITVTALSGSEKWLASATDITDLKKIQNKLEKNVLRFRALAEYNVDGIITTDSGGKILYFNNSLLEMFGYSRDELKNRELTLLMPERYRENFMNGIKKFQSTGEHHLAGRTLETIGLNSAGHEFPFEMSLTKWEAEKKVYFTSIIRDITERKKSEKALSDSEQKYSHLFSSVPVGIGITSLNGKIIDVNKAMQDITGYAPEELKNTNVKTSFVTPEDYELLLEELQESGKVRDYEVALKRKGQKIYYALLNSELIEIGGDKVILTTVRDITETKETEQCLINSEKRYRKLYSSMNEGLAVHEIIYDDANIPVDYEIIDVNNAYEEILGIKKKDIQRKRASDAYGAGKAPYIEVYSEVAETGNPAHFETYFEPLDKYFYISVFSPSKGTFATVFEDITSRKKAEVKIKKSLEEKEVLLREIHHRVKNNMQILSSLLNLQIQYEDSDETISVLKDSQGRVKSMAMIHEKLYQSSNFSNINFKEYLERLVSGIFYSYEITTGNIGSEIDIEDVNLNIDTAIPLGLIINELVTNSVKHAFPQGEGTISIKLKSLPEQMELTVADNGIGLPVNIDIQNPKTLGLQLVKSLTEQLDGDIRVERSNGTVFKITFKELKYKERI